MSTIRWVTGAALVLAVSAGALAQQRGEPHVGYVYPAGARQGTTTEVVLGGQFLAGVRGVEVSGTGVEGVVLKHERPIPRRELNRLRQRARELRKKPASPEVRRELGEIRLKVADFFRRMVTPALAETVRVRVTVAPDAEPGRREIRLLTPRGPTNPLVFCVGQLPEVAEKPAVDLPPLGVLRGPGRFGRQSLAAPSPEVKIDLPAVVNGQILPGQVDRIRFTARKGQRIVVSVEARALVPYLADAVPGWFQAAVGLYDAKHDELAFADHFQFHPDPVLFCEIPADGEYLLEVRDVIYRGRDDFVYRLTVGELPFITGIFPRGARAGSRTPVELTGWNLPAGRIVPETAGAAPGLRRLAVRRDGILSNRVPFAVDLLPEVRESEPNDTPGAAMPVSPPVIVNGRVEAAGAVDLFRFEGKAGREIVAEVLARRVGSPLDAFLKLTDAAGTTLAASDDCEDTASGLNTHHADPYIRFRLPADGVYFLHLGEVQRRGGPLYSYRLRISPPRPDFALRVVPSGLGVRAGWSMPLTVHVVRRDGFAGAVRLALEEAPSGFALSGAVVPAGADRARFTVTAPDRPLEEPVTLTLEGRALVGGRELVRPAVPAEDMMQAFLWRHLVPVQEMVVSVSRPPPRGVRPRILSPLPLKIPAGGTARLRVSVPLRTPRGQVRFELDQPPEGITLPWARPAGGGSEVFLRSDAAKVAPGTRGTLIIGVYFVPRRPKSLPAGRRWRYRKIFLGTLPAVPFEVVAKKRPAPGRGGRGGRRKPPARPPRKKTPAPAGGKPFPPR